MFTSFRRFIPLLVIPAFIATQASIAQEYIPAEFGEFKADFVERLWTPDLQDGDRLVVKCGAFIGLNGRFSNPYCYDDIEDLSFSREVSNRVRRATRNIRLEPARVDERIVAVWFNFSIIFTQQAGEQSAQVVENHMVNEAEYGLDYIAAQRWNDSSWSCGLLPNIRFNVTAFISENGELTGFGETENFNNDHCLRMVQRNMRSSQFIPATIDGSPVPSTYIELFGDLSYSTFKSPKSSGI